MPQQHVVDIALLWPVARRVLPGAGSMSVEPASPGRLLVVYRVRADGVIYYLRVAEEAGEDLTTDARVLARLAGLGVRVPAVVHVEAEPGDGGRPGSFHEPFHEIRRRLASSITKRNRTPSLVTRS